MLVTSSCVGSPRKQVYFVFFMRQRQVILLVLLIERSSYKGAIWGEILKGNDMNKNKQFALKSRSSLVLNQGINDKGQDNISKQKYSGNIEVMQSQNPFVDIDAIIQKLIYKSDQLTIAEISALLTVATQIFKSESSLLRLEAPIKICGDTHGQYTDLLRIFDKFGFPSSGNSYLFLGDYVDRGKQSTETFCLLVALKIKYQNDLFLLRGNHESAEINKFYGFYDECKRRTSIKIWHEFVQCFDVLPLAALVSSSILCMHGGISKHSIDVEDIDKIQRPCKIPKEGLVTDLLWADPKDMQSLFEPSTRKISYTFNEKVLSSYLALNKLDMVVRGHQVVEDGYEFMFNKKLVTIFSAPNYCSRFNNNCGVLNIKKTDQLICSIFLIVPESKRQEIENKIKKKSESKSDQGKSRPDSPYTQHKKILDAIIEKMKKSRQDRNLMNKGIKIEQHTKGDNYSCVEGTRIKIEGKMAKKTTKSQNKPTNEMLFEVFKQQMKIIQGKYEGQDPVPQKQKQAQKTIEKSQILGPYAEWDEDSSYVQLQYEDILD